MKTYMKQILLLAVVAVMGVSCEADLEIDQTVEEIKSAQPTITNISPTTAAVNSTVTIEGTFLNFATKAFIGDVEAQITSRITGQRLEVQVPNNAVAGTIRIVTEQEKEAVSADQLAITYPVPAFTGTLPTEGFVNETITFQGTDLTSVTAVNFGTANGIIEFQESQALVVRIPNNPGIVDISLSYLTTSGPETLSVASGFEVILPQPTIGGFPGVFTRDTEVIITGQDMNLITNGSIDGVAIEFTDQTPTEVKFFVPSSIATGYVDVLLNFDGGGVINRDGIPYINGQFAEIYEFDVDGLDVWRDPSRATVYSINGNVEQPPFPGEQYFASVMTDVTTSTLIRSEMDVNASEATADILDNGNYGDNPVLHFWMHTEGTTPQFKIYTGNGRRTLDTYTELGPNNDVDPNLNEWILYAVRLKDFIGTDDSTGSIFELRITHGTETDDPKYFNFDWFIVTDKVLSEFGALDVTDDFDAP